MPRRYVSDTYTTAHTEAQVPVGSEAELTAAEVLVIDSGAEGPWVLRYVYNDEASTAFAAGDCIIMDTDYASFDGILSTGTIARGRVLGFAIGAVPAGSYGWVCKTGDCLAKGDGSVAQGESIVSHSSNQVDTMASGEEEMIIGVALAADGSAGETFRVKADIP